MPEIIVALPLDCTLSRPWSLTTVIFCGGAGHEGLGSLGFARRMLKKRGCKAWENESIFSDSRMEAFACAELLWNEVLMSLLHLTDLVANLLSVWL